MVNKARNSSKAVAQNGVQWRRVAFPLSFRSRGARRKAVDGSIVEAIDH